MSFKMKIKEDNTINNSYILYRARIHPRGSPRRPQKGTIQKYSQYHYYGVRKKVNLKTTNVLIWTKSIDCSSHQICVQLCFKKLIILFYV